MREAREHSETYTALYKVIRQENAETADTWVGDAVTWETRKALDALGRQILSGPDAIKNPYEPRAKSEISVTVGDHN